MPQHHPGHSLESLPDEILHGIAPLLPKSALLRLRCVSRRFSSIATPHAFRSLRFRAYEDEPELFIRVAESEKLRPLVREINCDTWIGPDFVPRQHHPYKIPSAFFDALPFIGLFRNLDALHLRLAYDCGDKMSVEETPDFRYRILDTVFRSLAGAWSEDRQREIDDKLWFENLFHYRIGKVPAQIPQAPIALKALTVSNLQDLNDTRLTNSDAFRTIMCSTSLVDLRLYIATHTDGFDREFTSRHREKYDMFESLPSTWLRPEVAANLQVLSLYCHEPWGWYPKLDLRQVGAGGGMPNLKVLALGNFVFSHEWQMEWLASLNLEKLYIDGCAILFQAFHTLELDTSQTVLEKPDGEEVQLSNEGYLARGSRRLGNQFELEPFQPSLRWHTILTHWSKSMTNLRVFKMGVGDWDAAPVQTVAAAVASDPSKSSDAKAAVQPFTYNGFRYFDCPSPGTNGNDVFRNGTGIDGECDGTFDYVYWWDNYESHDALWEEREEEKEDMDEEEWNESYGEDEARKLGDEVKEKDKAALDLLLSTVEARRKKQ
ncbi:hypothetical protein ACJ41O_000219 [Fusarium nematophilum]